MCPFMERKRNYLKILGISALWGMSLVAAFIAGLILSDAIREKLREAPHWYWGEFMAKPVYAVMAEQADARAWRTEEAAITDTFHKGQLVRVWDDLWETEPTKKHWYAVSMVSMHKGKFNPDTMPDLYGGMEGSWVRAEQLNWMPLCSP